MCCVVCVPQLSGGRWTVHSKAYSAHKLPLPLAGVDFVVVSFSFY